MFKKILWVSGALAAVVTVYLGCASGGGNYVARDVAALPEAHGENPYVAYYTYTPSTQEGDVEVFSVNRWEKISAGGRADYLAKMYYATTRAFSRSGKKHQACFTGSASVVRERFFEWGRKGSLNFTPITIEDSNSSRDEMMIGITFKEKGQDRHFRLTACRGSGKGEFFDYDLLWKKISELEKGKEGDGRKPGSITKMMDLGRAPAAANNTDGFDDNDEVENRPEGAPTFALKADYNKAKPEKLPWLDANLDLSDREQAEKFALMLQEYAYEGMADQDLKNNDNNFIAQNSKSRFWCHMPWLNQGANGREGIHGLTQERNLQPSKDIWPDAPLGGDWGVAYFNSVGCKSVGKVFGTGSRPLKNPKWENHPFDDGAVVFKILFTTADFKEIKGAYTWNANVNLPNESEREVRPMKHIQMDIGVKHSKLKGLVSDKDGPVGSGWLMLTYYYDANYTPKLPARLKIPEGLRHMRPMGIQTGFDKNGTILFKDANTNQSLGLLNGPADNPKSSCMGCHGTAGTKQSMVPGVTSTKEWRDHVASGLSLDFGQQFALARRNYETKPKEK